MPLSRISSCYQKIARLGSRFCEQQQGPLKGPGTLLFAHWATAVHRGQPVGWISYPRHGGHTTAPYVLCTYHVCVLVGAALQAMELCLCGPVAGVNVSASWTSLAGVLGWHSYELPAVPTGLVLQLLADGSPALGQDRPVQAALLRYVLAWAFECAFGGARHVADGRILDGNQPVGANDFGRDAVFCGLQCLDARALYFLECATTCRYFLLGFWFQRKRRLALPSWRLTFTQRARPSCSAASRQRCILRFRRRTTFR